MLKLIKIFVITSLLFSTSAFAVLELELTQGVDDAMPIAIAPFAGQDLIQQVVDNDLKNSGHFRIIDADANGNISGKADALVTGKVSEIGNGQYQIAFKLFDIYNKTTLLDKQFTVKESQLRQGAHHVSDLIYEQLTGDRGVFSTKIAYILVQRQSAKQVKYQFQVADSDGYNPRTMLTSSFPLMSPAWSPDGKKIAYVSFEGNRAAIYVQDVASGSRQILSKFPGINGAPAWSPDGRKMALVLTQTGYPKIYVLDIATKNLQRITDDWFLDTEPDWARDGKSLIFTSNRGGSPQIYQVGLADKSVKRVTFDGPYNARASFTPDGKSIVMLHQDGDMFNIAIQDLDSSRVMVLTRTGFDESPSVAPNGRMVVYATSNGDRGVLAEVSTDGKVKLLLPAENGEVQEPAWSPFL